MKRSCIALSLLAAFASASAGADPLLTGFGGDRGFGDRVMAPNDDSYSSQLTLPFRINFFGNAYSSYWVNNNGNISFSGPLSTYSPSLFPISSAAMIAPFWADVDTRNQTSNMPSPFANNVYLANPDSKTLVVTWDTVGYYNQHNDKQNTFQLVLKDQSATTGHAGDFDMEFRYGQLQWTTGDASGGAGGLGGRAAVAGWNAGAETNSYSLVGSGTQNVLGLASDSNIGSDGVWRFHVRSEELPGSAPYNPVLPGNIDDGSAGWVFENMPVGTGTPIWIDPEVATGYDYTISSGPLVNGVTLLPGVGDGRYDIWLMEDGEWKLVAGGVAGGEHFEFGKSVDKFRVTGIEVEAGVNPDSPIAFSTGLWFDSVGNATVTQTALTVSAVPEPATYGMLAAGLAILGFAARRRRG
ncbi:nidogen-like domain-containing protein [Pseudoduganella chitinolytica]|uniref:Nidogen-like domain-containing protein n=1 Tax=Pseudoduganella chitinolytica TaxID=34070 RepID=A0ABY8BBI6_9BURK|nr:nidogen-like domain-containing protein [Pseudoduganella chitinolytica]WEF33272.1 nidogen-like domain-containing protein [Pseudoduganella chitinolytica]